MSPSEALRELGRANAEVEKLTGYLIVSLQAMQDALNAHLVIQTRKEARKRRAIARRRITLMARHLAKEPSL